MRALSSSWIIFSALLFGIMSVCVKFAAAHFSIMELVFYRSALGGILVLAFARLRHKTLRTTNFRVHCWRGITGFISLSLFFYALPKLDLSISMTLLQTSPLFFALLTVVFLRERMSPLLMSALAASFIGMLLILRPQMNPEELFAGAAAAGAGAAAGCAYFNIRRLGVLAEGGIRTVFYFAAICTVLSSAILLFNHQPMSPISANGAGWIVAIGITATAGQFALTRGLHYGSTFVASSLMYFGVIFAGMFDYLLWGDIPDALSWTGIILIMSGGIGALFLNRTQRNQQYRRAT